MSKEKGAPCYQHDSYDPKCSDCYHPAEQPQGEPSRCPTCGYTKEDADYNLDHHLCKNSGNAPWERAHDAQPEGGETPCNCSPELASLPCPRHGKNRYCSEPISPPAQTSAPYRKVFKRAWHVYRGEDHIALMNCSDDAEQNAELIVTALNALVAQPSAGTAREFYQDLQDYRQAPSGIGPHAFSWKDKPHRLIYDLVEMVAQLRQERDALDKLAARLQRDLEQTEDCVEEEAKARERAESALREAVPLFERVKDVHQQQLSSGTGKITVCTCSWCNLVNGWLAALKSSQGVNEP